MIVADFLGGPHRGDLYKKEFQVQVSFIDYLVFKVFGVHACLNRVNKKYNQNFNEDYFTGVRVCVRK
mgnify:CR=1 FL=1